MTDQLKIQGVVEMSAEGAERALDRVGEKAGQMANAVAKSADQAGKAVDGIGSGADASAEQFNRAEGKMSAAIKRATTNLELLGKTASQKFEFRINEKGLDPAKFEPVLAKMRELEAAHQRLNTVTGQSSAGMSGQFTNNVRNASYQLQDFTVQVNGGVDATKALGMQLPQLLGSFGAFGAVLGVAAALLPNIVQAFGSAADSSKTLDQSMSDLNKAVGDVGSTVKTFDMEKLYEEFNKANGATRQAIVEQLNFQREFIRTSELVASKKFGDSLGDLGAYGTLDKLAGSFAGSGAEKLAKQLGVTVDIAKDLLPVINGLKTGTEDVNSAFQRFGTVLLGGNSKAVALAGTMNDLAKAERESASASSAISEAQEKMAKGYVQTKKDAEGAAKATKTLAQEQDALNALLNTINSKSSDFDAAYVKNVETLLTAYGKGKLTLGEFNDVFQRYVAMQPAAVAAAKELAKAEESINNSRNKYMMSLESETEKLIEKAKAAELENAAIGLSAAELERLTELRYSERIELLQAKAAAIEMMEGRNLEVESIEAQIAALQRLKSAEIAKPKLQAQAREWQNFTRDIERSLTDALYRSFESGDGFGKSFAKNLENTFKSMVLKFAIQQTVSGAAGLGNSLINSILGTGAANDGAGVNYLGLANNAQSAYSLYGAAAQLFTGSAVGASSASLAYANAVGMVGGDSLGALIAANGQWAGVSTGATGAAGAEAAGASTGAATGVASAAWIAAIIAGMYMSSEAHKAGVRWEDTYAKDARKEWWYGLDSLAVTRDLHDAPAKAVFGDDFVNSEFYAVMFGSSLSGQIHKAVQNAIFGGQWEADGSTRFTGSFNEANAGMTGGNYLQDYKKDGGWFKSDKSTTEAQQISDAFDSVLDRMYKGFKDSYVQIGKLFDDNDLADKLVGFAARISIDDISSSSAMQSMAQQLGDAMGRVLFPSIAAMQTSGEAWAATFQRVVSEVDAVNRVFSTLGTTLAEQFGKNNVDKVLRLSDSLVTLFGGVDAMLASVQTYYAGYYSKPEQADQQRAIMAAQFEALGVAMPETRTEFRRLVESMDLTSSAGQKTYVSLINMSTAFGTWADSLANTVDEVTNEIEQALSGLFDGLLQSISSARDGLADARAAITNIGQMTPAQIRAGIAGAVPNLPGIDRVITTSAAIEQAKTSATANISAATAARDREQAAVNERNRGWAYKAVDLPMIGGWAFNGGEQINEMWDIYNRLAGAGLGTGFSGSSNYRNSSATFNPLPNGYQYFLDGSPIGQSLQLNHWQDGISANGQSWGRYNRDLDVYAYKPYGNEAINPIYDQNIGAAKAAGAASITAAETAATQAQIDYSKAIRQYVVDAGKAVEKLNDLRDETVSYYQAQQDLANAMLASANGLREAVKIARQSQMTEEELQAQRLAEFNRAYSMALITDGTVQASYADKMAGLLPVLVSSLENTAATQYDWARASASLYAQSNTIASSLEGQAAFDYQTEALGLLGAIDAALTSIEANASSAEKIISDAVYETGATNVEGLRAVIAAIQGKPIPAFATGGLHTGGIRLVGENGPELEVTGPARYFSAAQTSSMLAGDSSQSALLNELRALRDENRAQASAIVQTNNRLLRLHERWEGNGMPETRVVA